MDPWVGLAFLFIFAIVAVTGWLDYRRNLDLIDRCDRIRPQWIKRHTALRMAFSVALLLILYLGSEDASVPLFLVCGALLLAFDCLNLWHQRRLMTGNSNRHTPLFLQGEMMTRWARRSRDALPLSDFVGQAIDVLLVFDQGRLVEANDRASTLFKCPVTDLIGLETEMLFESIDPQRRDCALLLGDQNVSNIVFKAICSDQTRRIVRVRADSFFLGIRRFRFIAAADITEERARAAKWIYASRHDSLTGLANRKLLFERLEEAIEHYRQNPERPFALLLIDFETAWQTGESLSYITGDQWRLRIAETLRSVTPSGDTVAWLEHGCFALLLSDMGRLRRLVRHVRLIRQQFDRPFLIQGYHVIINAGLGAVLPTAEQLDSAEQLLSWATLAAHEAKKVGSFRLRVFDETMLNRSIARLNMQNDILNGLMTDEFSVDFQPVFCIQKAEHPVCAFEALARWTRADGTKINPAEFIAVAEESYLIDALGEHLIKKACERFLVWSLDHPDFSHARLSVNLSALQFGQVNLVASIKRILQEVNLSPDRLKLEITETTIMEDLEASVAKLKSLRALGIEVSIDDFGSGYSSLTYLLKIPADEIKIDRSFIDQLDDKDGKGLAIIQAIVTIARSCQITVVAEGVETQSQYDALKALGCDRIQGYLLSKPLPFNQLERFFSGDCEGEKE